MLLRTPMMSIANTVPSIFQTLSPLLLKSMNFNFWITHSNKTKNMLIKATIKETNFFVFLIKQCNQNKIKQNNKQSKRLCMRDSPCRSLLPSRQRRQKTCWWCGVDDVNDRPVGNPKRRCDEHSSKFSLSYETKVINPLGES
jgi:hypothetical protein